MIFITMLKTKIELVMIRKLKNSTLYNILELLVIMLVVLLLLYYKINNQLLIDYI